MRQTMWMTGLLALTGCFHVTRMPTCDEEAEPVPEDHAHGAWTPATLAERVEGAWVVRGTFQDGGETEVEVAVVRTGGAEKVYQTRSFHETRSLGFGSSELSIAVRCRDYLRIPVEVDVQTPDGEVDVVQQGYARTGQPPFEGPSAFPIHSSGPVEEAQMPLFGESPADWEDTEAFVTVWAPAEDNEPLHGELGWSGTLQTEDSMRHQIFRVLTW